MCTFLNKGGLGRFKVFSAICLQNSTDQPQIRNPLFKKYIFTFILSSTDIFLTSCWLFILYSLSGYFNRNTCTHLRSFMQSAGHGKIMVRKLSGGTYVKIWQCLLLNKYNIIIKWIINECIIQSCTSTLRAAVEARELFLILKQKFNFSLCY